MGAPAGTCPAAGPWSRTVHLAAGTYDMEGLTLVHRAFLSGKGAGNTLLQGTVVGLRTEGGSRAYA